jgi:hypothetical protein
MVTAVVDESVGRCRSLLPIPTHAKLSTDDVLEILKRFCWGRYFFGGASRFSLGPLRPHLKRIDNSTVAVQHRATLIKMLSSQPTLIIALQLVVIFGRLSSASSASVAAFSFGNIMMSRFKNSGGGGTSTMARRRSRKSSMANPFTLRMAGEEKDYISPMRQRKFLVFSISNITFGVSLVLIK